MSWLKRIDKFWKSAIGVPYLDVELRAVDDKVEIKVDYNAAFIKQLDGLGYVGEPDDKVNEYVKSVVMSMNEQEIKAAEEEDQR